MASHLRVYPSSTEAPDFEAPDPTVRVRLGDLLPLVAMELELDPALRVSNLPDVIPLRRPEDLARYIEGLRKAGLPE